MGDRIKLALEKALERAQTSGRYLMKKLEKWIICRRAGRLPRHI